MPLSPAQKGEVKNPAGHGGRLGAACRPHVDEAVGVLLDVMRSPGALDEARVMAAQAILRGSKGQA